MKGFNITTFKSSLQSFVAFLTEIRYFWFLVVEEHIKWQTVDVYFLFDLSVKCFLEDFTSVSVTRVHLCEIFFWISVTDSTMDRFKITDHYDGSYELPVECNKN